MSERAWSVRVRVSRHDPWRVLTWGAMVGLAAAAAMAVAGLPPLDLHGILHRVGIMDPLCGGTRAVRLAARGDWAASVAYNPIGVPLVLGAVTLLARAAVGWATQRWVTVQITLDVPGRHRLKVLAGAAVIALQVNQQLHAPLLMQAD